MNETELNLEYSLKPTWRTSSLYDIILREILMKQFSIISIQAEL